jgi:CHAT domain
MRNIEANYPTYGDRFVGHEGWEWSRARLRSLKRFKMARHEIAAIDLDIKVTIRTVDGGKVLRYALSSPSGAAPLTHREVQTVPLKGSFDAFRDRLISRIEAFQEHLDPYGSGLQSEEFEPELRKLGNELYRQLFPIEMKWMYRQWREKVRTIQISSDEWWIPWELIRPFDHELEPVVDDDFLCARYQITRWLIGGTAPAAMIRVERMACVEAGESEGPRLPSAVRERELLTDLTRRLGIEDDSPSEATFPDLMALLKRGRLGLLHFAGHGEFSRENPEDSRILLADGRSLAAGDLEGPLLRALAKDRPLVYFNACSVAQQGARTHQPVRLARCMDRTRRSGGVHGATMAGA